MALKVNDTIIPIELPSIDGTVFNTSELSGKKYMLSFFRFATCPFCNLRMHELVTRFEEFGENFTIVAVFDSPLANLQKYAGKHDAPFPVLADPQNKYYREFEVKKSISGMLKGMIFRFPKLIYGMLVRGYFPFPLRGSLLTLPVDILVNENGIVQNAYYGKDEGDHLEFDKIKEFSRNQS